MTRASGAGRVPVTTTSDRTQAHFELRRDAAHHYRFELARDELDAALALDATFVLALLHRGGSADSVAEARAYIEEAEANRSHASEAEGRMIDAFRAFLLDRAYEQALACDPRFVESRAHLARARAAEADLEGPRPAGANERDA